MNRNNIFFCFLPNFSAQRLEFLFSRCARLSPLLLVLPCFCLCVKPLHSSDESPHIILSAIKDPVRVPHNAKWGDLSIHAPTQHTQSPPTFVLPPFQSSQSWGNTGQSIFCPLGSWNIDCHAHRSLGSHQYSL